MLGSNGRIRTTHVGSITRPDALKLTPGTAPKAGTDAAYEAELRSDVQGVVSRQLSVGLDSVNDGEFGKSSWAAYIIERLNGFELHPERPKPLVWLGKDVQRFPEFFAQSELSRGALHGGVSEVIVGPISYGDETPVRRDLDNLLAAASAAGLDASDRELFFTSIAPGSVAYNGVDEYYGGDDEAFIQAVSEAVAVEYRIIHEAGVVLQVDDAILANMYDYLHSQGEGVFERWAQRRIDALNHALALAQVPAERVRYHICFGSWHVPHTSDAPLSAMLPFVLQVNAGAFSIEAANARHEHEFTVWEEVKLPDDKLLIPGVISHHTTTVEHPELVAMRIRRFADLVGPERVIAGADCGFAQNSSIQRTHPEVMWAKFESLVEGARIASERLF